jgi:hypothetical protein
MVTRPGLRRPRYSGNDPEAGKFADGVNNSLKFLQGLPSTSGVQFTDRDFSAIKSTDGYNVTVPLPHTMGRKAQGVHVLNCKSKDQNNPSCPTAHPTHLSQKDTNTICYVNLTTDMAKNFLWSLWVF